jgi:antitoxin component YwqK of YwqJK toxin-antitoxin module
MSKEVNWERGHYDNGQIMFETPWVNDQKHGIARYWHENGQLWWEIPYVNGQEHGIQKRWHSNGQLEYEIPWVNGQQHGIEKFWKEDSKLWSIEKWHQDQRVINIEFDPIPGDSKMEWDLITNIMTYE